MADIKNKRTAPSVQDVINGNGAGQTRTKFKSGYTGPKKTRNPGLQMNTGAIRTTGVIPTLPSSDPGPSSTVRPAAAFRSGSILDYAWIAYVVILATALTTAILMYTKGSGASREGIYYPNNIFTVTGVVKDIFADYRSGGLGSGYTKQEAGKSESEAASAPDETVTGENPDATTDTNDPLGENTSSVAPNSTTGATMALDVGSSYGSYGTATSHEQLIEQLDQALAANEVNFVGMKLAYEDPETKTLIGYPQSVVEHFTGYMADNSDKRATFLAQIKDAGEFSVKNGSAYLVKLPLLQFTINMGYDGTTISISGFADQVMNSGQSAVVSPLLPCMYTIHAETAKGSQTSEVECNMNEGNLKINIGIAN